MTNLAVMAGKQSRRIRGRPGVNGLRVDERIVVTPELLEVIGEISEKSGVNAREMIAHAEGL